MTRRPFAWLRRRLRREEGQAIIIIAAAMVTLLGFAGLAIDVGRVYVAQRQLQQAVDAAALVAGQNLPNSSSAYTAATSYTATGLNSHNDMVAGTPKITFECDPLAVSSGAPCQGDTSGNNCQPAGAQAPTPSGTTTCDAVMVSESATVPTTLLSLFTPSLSIVSANSIAAAHGGIPHPIDIMLILDTTGSTANPAATGVCPTVTNPDKLDCEKSGTQTLLANLLPCTAGSTCGASNPPVDEVGLMVDPPITSTSYVTDEEDCTKDLPTTGIYDDPTTITKIGGVTVKGTWAKGSTTITLNTATTGIVAVGGGSDGAEVIGAGIPLNTEVQSVNAAAKTITITNATTVAGSGTTISFDNRPVDPTTNTNEPNGLYTYQIVPFENSFANWNAGTNSFQPVAADPLTKAIQTGTCGLEPGGDTSFATVLGLAQQALFNLHDGHTHVIIFLSDGGANYGPVYYSADASFNPADTPESPYRSYPCQQAVNTAQQAAATGTLIFSIGYWQNNTTDQNAQCLGLTPGKNGDAAGQTTIFHSPEAVNTTQYPKENANDTTVPSGLCATETNPLTGCWAMYNIASDPSKFYPDPSSASLNSIFKQVAVDLTTSRLISG